jgi:hypothetical protein
MAGFWPTATPTPLPPGFCRAGQCQTPMRMWEHLWEELRPRTSAVESLPPRREAASRGLMSGMNYHCCSCIKYCLTWQEVSLVIRKLETEASSPWGIWQGGDNLPERLLFAGPQQQAAEMNLNHFLGQEDILHPWVVLDFFKGWPCWWSQAQALPSEILTLWRDSLPKENSSAHNS